MKKTGVELIAEERNEQIEKHGFNDIHDSEHLDCELMQAAVYLLTQDEYYYPPEWDKKWLEKFKKKDYVGRLKVAGALIAAELDRLHD